MAWGGRRANSGRKKANPAKPVTRAEPKLPAARPTLAAEVKAIPAIDPKAWITMLPEIEEISRRYSVKTQRTRENNPYRLPTFPKAATPPERLTMAMDNALVGNLNGSADAWLAGPVLDALPGEGLLFLGYTYLSELAQRPEYRVMTETIADDATRNWIDFDVVGDENKQREDREKDPQGYDERMADPDEREKRVEAAGKGDKVKELKDDQLRLCIKDRYYDQCRNDGFFGRSHLFRDIRVNGGDEMNPDELKTPIGDSRGDLSKSKVPVGSFKALRAIEPVWTYPLMYNAINPLREDWYNPQVWYVMGQEIHGSRLATFVGHPVPDMLKPAYAFGGLSLTQMAKPYVDIWLQTRQSVADLIHSFSVMVLMTDLSTILQPGNAGALLARVAMFNMLRDNQGAFVVNKNTEDFKNVSASLSGLHELQAQAQEHMASVHRIPLVKFTGIQPSGLNASSEGEIKTYDDTISAYQSRFMDPHLRQDINFEQLSLWGEVDPEITHRWVPLREITQAEKGTKEKDDAERNQKYVDMGAISPGEVRKIIIDDPDLPFTGLNPDDLPEPPADEGLLGPGAGGAAAEHEEASETAAGGEGGGANDAALPFGATDEWREGDHPRAPDGKFGSGTGKGGGSGKQTLKMPQFGLTPTPWESHQHGYKMPARKPMPKSSGEPGGAGSVVAFKPGEGSGIKALNGVAIKSWEPPASWEGWAGVEGQADVGEPPEPSVPKGMRLASGVIIRESDGRVWLMRPAGGFGGYDQTFPKGGAEEGLSLQANAIKEAYEETGLKVRITGFAGDHEGDTSVTRFYVAERTGGDPADAGEETEGVVLAPVDQIGGMLNRKRDREIAAGLRDQTPLDPDGLKKVGGKMGTNEGGTFEDGAGNRFYVKRPQSKAHVENELAAARLYQLAGVNTLNYRPVKGGNHVATDLAKLDKNNVSQLTPAQRAEAAKDFAIHAWLSNYDAAGTGGDNQGVLGGKVTTLDVGGSLRYRAQGAPKGKAFGNKVAEVDSMRDPKISPDAAKLFGKMTDADMTASAQRVTSIPDSAIRKAVGADDELADVLIERKKDLAQRFGLMAADEAPFEEGKHPRGPDGKFTSGGGGGSSAPSPIKKPEPGKPSAFGGLYKHTSGDDASDYVATAEFYLKQPAKSGTHYRNLLKNLIENADYFGVSETIKTKLKAHLGSAWANAGAGIIQKAQAAGGTEGDGWNAAMQDAKKAYQKAEALGWKPDGGVQAYAEQITTKKDLGSMAGQKAPPLVKQPPQKVEIKKQNPPPTAAELQKASKNVPLQMQYVPGGVDNPAGHALVKKFNDKWANKGNLTPANLIEKVNDFKDLADSMKPLQGEAQKQSAANAEKQKATAQAEAKAKAAKAAEQAKESEKKNKALMDELGISPQQASGVAELAQMLGSSTGDIINSFKKYEEQAKSYGYPISGFQCALIKNYSNGGYTAINKSLRSGAWTLAQHAYVAMVNKALMGMPKHSGGGLTRGTVLSAEQQAAYVEGKIKQEDAFMSTSTGGGFGGNTTFKVTSIGKRGANIKKLSNHPGENEVLFAAKTYFKVDKVEGKPGGPMTIHMTEWEEHV